MRPGLEAVIFIIMIINSGLLNNKCSGSEKIFEKIHPIKTRGERINQAVLTQMLDVIEKFSNCWRRSVLVAICSSLDELDTVMVPYCNSGTREHRW